MIDWLIEIAREYANVFLWLTALSLISIFVVMTVWVRVLSNLPADYFVNVSRRDSKEYLNQFHPSIRVFIPVIKNAMGIVLVVAGFLMLFIPGQGLITILAGIMLMNFPGKYRCERWLVNQPQVRRSINWLRRRAGQPEFMLD